MRTRCASMPARSRRSISCRPKPRSAQRRENLIRARTTAEDAEDRAAPADHRSGRRVVLAACGSIPIEEPTRLARRCRTSTPRSRRRSTSATTSRERDTSSRTRRRTWSSSTIRRLPDVRLETSYRGNGLGGTQFLRDRRIPGLGHRHARSRLWQRARPGLHATTTRRGASA